jgi:hypothetical protein
VSSIVRPPAVTARAWTLAIVPAVPPDNLKVSAVGVFDWLTRVAPDTVTVGAPLSVSVASRSDQLNE